jgi:hypothetical protein
MIICSGASILNMIELWGFVGMGFEVECAGEKGVDQLDLVVKLSYSRGESRLSRQ